MTEGKPDLGVACRGCKVIYKRLLVHLNSKNGMPCKALYREEELVKPSKSKNHYAKNQTQILEKKKSFIWTINKK